MVEIPDLPKKELQKIFREMWMGTLMGDIGFIVRKLGPEALDELNDAAAEHCATDLRRRGVDDPLKFAMGYAIINKNVFGSDVEVDGNEMKAVLNIKRCANLETAMEFKEKGMPITREEHCNGCIEGYFRRVTGNLGFGLGVEFTDTGCRMSISR